MTDTKLATLLEKIHRELGQTEAVDEKGRELLRKLDADIHELLGRSQAAGASSDPSALGRLQEAITHFEATHPALTSVLSEMMTTLSNAGV